MSDHLLDAALWYASRLGWRVFPTHSIRDDGSCTCSRGVECPPKQRGKHPRTSRGHNDATADLERIRAWWGTWPGSGIGLATGEGSGVWVLDVDAAKGGLDTLAGLIEEHGGAWIGCRQETGGGGLHLLFRAGPDSGIRTRVEALPGVDVRGDGGYAILPPSDHASGATYEWQEDADPAARAPVDAPAWLLELAAGSPARREAAGVEESRGGLDPDLARELRSALSVIPAEGRDDWVRVGMALKRTGGGDAAFALWVEWSETCPEKFDLADARRVWRSFDLGSGAEGEIGPASVFHLAQVHGWANPGRGVVESARAAAAAPTSVEVPDADEVELMPELNGAPLPDELLVPPGLLGRLASWLNEATVRRQPVAALATAVACLGALYGRRYRTPTDLRTNLYVVVLGPTGCGKDGPRNRAKVAFERAGLGEFVGGEDWASGQGILGSLGRHPSQVFMVDEIAEVVDASVRRGASEHVRKIIPTLMRLYSSANTTFRGSERASVERVDLIEPHACLLGTSTAEAFYPALSSGRVVDGFLNRMIVLQTFDARPRRQWPERSDPPEDLVAELRRHDEAGRPEGNVSALTGDGVARVVPFSPAARATLEAFEDELDAQLATDTGPEARALWQRVAENAQKLALVRAVGCNAATPCIGVDDVRWALALAQWSVRNLEAALAWNLSDSHFEATAKRILRVVGDLGGHATRARVMRRVKLPKRQLDEAIAYLQETGQVEVLVEQTGGRPRTTYRARGR